jgi:MFS family permease
MRFILGLAEAGFFPGVILYLTQWYPAARRARWIATFMTAIPFSGVFGGPLSGWLLRDLSGARGLAGWQWLLMIEALPSLVMGVLVLMYLDNGIRSAKWLTEDEKKLLETNLANDASGKADGRIADVFRDYRVWWMSLIYFALIMGLYGVVFWLPTIIRGVAGEDPFTIGLYTAIPYSAAAAAMVSIAQSADRTGERRYHLAIPAVVGGVGLVLSTLASGHLGVALTTLAIGTAGVITTIPNFWSLPTAFLGRSGAAAGIAIINSFGNLAGFVAPYLVGFIIDKTGSNKYGMYTIAASLTVGAGLILAVPAKLVNRQR